MAGGMFGGGYGGGAPGMGGASPSAFTSPGLNPMALALLMSMQGGGRGMSPAGAPGLPAPMQHQPGQPFQPLPPPTQAQMTAPAQPNPFQNIPKPATPAAVPPYQPGQTAPNMYNAPIGPGMSGQPLPSSLMPGYMPAAGGGGGGNPLSWLSSIFGGGYNGGYVPPNG
jgi:hypothetical protein